MKKIIFLIIIILIVYIFQFNSLYFISSLSSLINPFLIISVLLLLFYNLKFSLIWVLIGAFLLDLYSLNFFGLYLIAYSLTIYAVNFFFKRFFTNRSFYSFIILSMISTFSYFLFLSGFSQFFRFFNLAAYAIRINGTYILSIFFQILINASITGLVYFFALYVNDRLKANFILKKQY